MRGFAGPGIAAGHDQSRFPFRRQVRAFDVLMHFAKARHGGEVGLVEAFADFTREGSGRADPGDALAGDHNLLILPPGAGVDIEQPADAQ